MGGRQGSWALNHSSSTPEIVPPDLLKSHGAVLVYKRLCCFVLETRKIDGSRYPPATLQLLVSGLNQQLQQTRLPSRCWIRDLKKKP